MDSPQLLTYQQLADKIESALGARPAISTLRTAGTRTTGILAGLPRPLYPAQGRLSPLFSAAQVDEWLANHQIRRQQAAVAELIAASPSQRAAAVAAARSERVSWVRIADAISQADGRRISYQAVAKRYGH